MKTFKFLFSLLICIIVINVFAFSMTNSMTKDDVEKTETININDTHNIGWENQRSFYHLECLLYKTSKYVKVNYSGLCDLNVYILDVQNNIVAYQYGDAIDGTIEVPVILENGVYRIHIESDTYCGEGYFEI